MSRDISDDSDYSDNESLIIRHKKGMVIQDSSDEEFTSADERSKSIMDESTIGIANGSILSNEDRSELESVSIMASSNKKQSDSDIISETDEERSDISSFSNNMSKNISAILSDNLDETATPKKKFFITPQQKNSKTHRNRPEVAIISSDTEDEDYRKSSIIEKRRSFRTPQNKKPEILDSDSEEGSVSNTDPDMINSSQILEDSFESERPNMSVKKKTKAITPKTPVQQYNIISSDSEEIDTPKLSAREEIKQVMPNDLVQTKLDDLLKKMSVNNVNNKNNILQNEIECKRTEYNEQLKEIQKYEQEMLKIKKLMSTIKLSNLPDKGMLLKDRFETYKAKFLGAQNRLKNMNVVEEDIPGEITSEKKIPSGNWNNIEAGIAIVQPKTFGKKGLENHNLQKALTAETLEQLHGSLKNSPKDHELAEQPKGIKVTLMEHQRRALAWMSYREALKPPGGILADDMGLGKTLTMISLVLKSKETEIEHDDDEDDEEEHPSRKYRKVNGGTLVVCPASLLNQWAQEIDTKLKRGMLSYNVYHGPKREVKPKKLAEHDFVITTYSIVMNEHDKGAIFRVRWARIILDEAHQIRNHKAQTSIACCALAAKCRWALTGTPVHNKELDMYALLKFLRCSPFDDLAVWKRWVGDKSSGGGERLNTVISSLMLRRTKAELMAQGKLDNLPSRNWDLMPISLDQSEMDLYQKILLFSQTLFAQFLHQKAEKNQEIANFRTPNAEANSEYSKMRKKLMRLNRMKEVNQHEILVLLLRLRQICCHPSLIVNMLQGDEDLGDEEPEDREEMNLLEQLNKLNLDDDSQHPSEGISGEVVGFKEATKGILNPSHPLFAKGRISSKVKCAMKLIPNILATGDKIIIVSQWTSFLELFGLQLKEAGIKFSKLDGSVPTAKRTEMVTDFNEPGNRVKVLLLSLTAGGVGLNLVGANHLFLLDLHWNPQLEKQAQDRIYRMGQKKNVNIYKFMASETIEERIKKLQEDKLAVAESMMTGSKQVIGNKLSLQDLKMLFNM